MKSNVVIAFWMVVGLVVMPLNFSMAQAEPPSSEISEGPLDGDTPAVEEAPTEAVTISLGDDDDIHPGIDIESSEGSAELISISLDNVPIQDAIRMFSRLSGANIIAGTELEGNVTVSLKDVEWGPALEAILDSVGLVLVERSPGIFTIMSKADVAGEPVTVGNIFLKFTTTDELMPIVKNMLVSSNATVSAFASANALVIKETNARLNVIREFVEQIDIPRPQVFIEVKFVELNEQAIEDLGINWEVLSGYTIKAGGLSRDYTETRTRTRQSATVAQSQRNRGRTFNNTSESSSGSSGEAVTGAVGGDTSEATVEQASSQKRTAGNNGTDFLGNLLVEGRNFSDFDAVEGTITTIPPFESMDIRSAVLSAEEFAITLSALKQNDGVKIVSDPKIVVASGQTANIHVGRNEPNIIALPQGDTGDRFAYSLDPTTPWIEIGVKLEVTPIVNTENNVTVRIAPELSRKLADKIVGEAGTSFPVTQIREIQTEFNIESGRTVAIGGLTTTEDVENIKKIPVLGDIPIIGKYLFSHKHTEQIQDEIIIFVSVAIADPTDIGQHEGLPSEGKLIHKYLARKAMEEKEADEKAVDIEDEYKYQFRSSDADPDVDLYPADALSNPISSLDLRP